MVSFALVGFCQSMHGQSVVALQSCVGSEEDGTKNWRVARPARVRQATHHPFWSVEAIYGTTFSVLQGGGIRNLLRVVVPVRKNDKIDHVCTFNGLRGDVPGHPPVHAKGDAMHQVLADALTEVTLKQLHCPSPHMLSLLVAVDFGHGTWDGVAVIVELLVMLLNDTGLQQTVVTKVNVRVFAKLLRVQAMLLAKIGTVLRWEEDLPLSRWLEVVPISTQTIDVLALEHVRDLHLWVLLFVHSPWWFILLGATWWWLLLVRAHRLLLPVCDKTVKDWVRPRMFNCVGRGVAQRKGACWTTTPVCHWRRSALSPMRQLPKCCTWTV